MPREDFIPYVADFFLQLEDVKWTVIAGIVNDSLVVSVRNLGYTQERRRVRAALLRRHRQRRRPSRDGQGGGAAARVPREVRRPAGGRDRARSCRSSRTSSCTHDAHRREEERAGAQAESGIQNLTNSMRIPNSRAPDRDPRSDRPRLRARPTAAACPCVTPAAFELLVGVAPLRGRSPAGCIRLSMPPRLAARLTICSRS